MNHLKNTKTHIVVTRLFAVLVIAAALLLAGGAQAATPGITGTATGAPVFNLDAAANYISQPDGAQIYSWGYGCAAATTPSYKFAPAVFNTPGLGVCPTMQVPGPTLIVTEGDVVTVNLTNSLPPGAGNTSIMFPGFQVCGAISGGTCTPNVTGAAGLLTREAIPGGSVTYRFVATTPGTRAYYSGTQSDLQIEMGLYGAIVVLPKPKIPLSNCSALGSDTSQNLPHTGEYFRLAPSAYDHEETCYDREYLFQFMELDPRIHTQAEAQTRAIASCINTATTTCPTTLSVKTEPYHPSYFLINGRSMPDDMDPDYAPNYPHQPYNGNPHMHPGDLTLLRTIGQGRWEHPFHQHGNHVRILARDGNLILSQNDKQTPPRLGGRMEFTTDTYPGQSYDGIFYWSGKGLGWDIYGHTPVNGLANPPCDPGSPGTPNYGYDTTTAAKAAGNYFEWCADHNHPLETNPTGQIAGGGSAAQFDPQVATNGLWYNGTPYLGPDAVTRNRGTTPLPPGTASQNPLSESGIAFMWHSHNEREITTNDVFPGGMLMMMLVDPPVWYIDETL
jgi:FtsP/CotA-like multicopper oxidase with cupredoxin domain